MFVCEPPFHENRLTHAVKMSNNLCQMAGNELTAHQSWVDTTPVTIRKYSPFGSLRASRCGCIAREKPPARIWRYGKSMLSHIRRGFGAEVGYDEANLFVGDFGREGFLEGLQAVHSQLAAGGGDLVVPFGG